MGDGGDFGGEGVLLLLSFCISKRLDFAKGKVITALKRRHYKFSPKHTYFCKYEIIWKFQITQSNSMKYF